VLNSRNRKYLFIVISIETEDKQGIFIGLRCASYNVQIGTRCSVKDASSELFVTTRMAARNLYRYRRTLGQFPCTNKLLVMKEPTDLLPGD
jgi:hypothetical protein